jgi:ComF family protein
MDPIGGTTCEICGENLPGISRPSGIQICAVCVDTRPHFSKATAYGAYDGELRELIHLLKYEQVIPAAGVLGVMLTAAIAKLGIDCSSMLVIPVPLHSSKRRQRGFNQSELIARAALKQVPISGAELSTNMLERRRDTVSQIGLTRPQRNENIRGAFRVMHPNTVAGRNVLLVDDVLTTGTTVSECARILRKAGAKQVWVATVARTLKNSSANFEIEPNPEVVARA